MQNKEKTFFQEKKSVSNKGFNKKKPFNDSPLKILLMDDSLFFTEMLVCYFSKLKDYKILGVAYRGEQLLDLAKKIDSHVLIMDLSIPGADSLKILREFKKISPSTRVIVCSGLSGEHIIMQCLLNGVEDFIAKPFSIDRLLYSLSS